MDLTMIVCMDGPAGSGKSSISKLVAKEAGFTHLDTGAFYRSLALLAKLSGVSFDDANGLSNLAQTLQIDFISDHGKVIVMLADSDVSDAIRTPEISDGASRVSVHASVREKIVCLQQEYGKKKSCVAEGRDTASVVFPHAELKIYLDASLEERAKRRLEEYRVTSPEISIREVQKDMKIRDERDTNRSESPLKKDPDAIVLDTTEMSKDEVVSTILKWIEAKKCQ